MGRGSALATAMLVRLGEVTNRTFVLPLLIFYPTSRCNSRCVSCDWWRHDGADDLTLKEIADVADGAAGLGTRIVAFSGGEPLLRPDVFRAAGAFRGQGIAPASADQRRAARSVRAVGRRVFRARDHFARRDHRGAVSGGARRGGPRRRSREA